MPQFDIFYFFLFSFLIFLASICVLLIIFFRVFNTLFKIKIFSKNFVTQRFLILTIKNEIAIVKKARVYLIKKKILDFNAF